MIQGAALSCASSADRRDPLKAELEDLRKLHESEAAPKCRPGTVAPCFDGPPESAGRGICRAGERRCSESGHWGPCKGQILPKARELCNELDDDCNGVVDDGFPRVGSACEVGVGACKATGVYQCRADKSTADCSVRPKAPRPEVCDGVDNDCDGKIDEDPQDAGQACNTGQPGLCQAGRMQCVNAELRCVALRSGTQEICNQRDDDCDGLVDEDCVPASP